MSDASFVDIPTIQFNTEEEDMKTKLSLNRETVRNLTEKELSNVDGAFTPTRPCLSYPTFQSDLGPPLQPCIEFTENCGPGWSDFC